MKIKLERQIYATGFFYDVMLSPFDEIDQIKDYIVKYKDYYPLQDQVYKITFYDENGMLEHDSKE